MLLYYIFLCLSVFRGNPFCYRGTENTDYSQPFIRLFPALRGPRHCEPACAVAPADRRSEAISLRHSPAYQETALVVPPLPSPKQCTGFAQTGSQ